MYLMRTGSYSPAPLMVTVQPSLINWEIYPSTSARTKISLVSWIVSTETDPKAGGAYSPGTPHWSCTSWIRLSLNQLRRPPWSIWPSRWYSSWLFGYGKCRSEIHAWQNKNIRHQSDWSTVSTYLSNTLTQFYLKGVAWADSELYQLDSVWAAQQIHRWPLDWGDLYVHSINSFYMYIVKNVMCFLWEVYWHCGTDLIPLFPLPQSRSVKKGGGATSV